MDNDHINAEFYWNILSFVIHYLSIEILLNKRFWNIEQLNARLELKCFFYK
jgi:hypothetical protein